MNSNLELYERVREVPKEAIKAIQGGKLKGKSDINPMWRIKKLTEVFGPCGTGWYTEKLSEDKITLSNGEIIILVEINLYVKIGEEWQKPIYGTGGSMLLQFEKGNLVSNDEGRKMAYTDAISVACKALGFAADVYWNSDRTKYDGQTDNTSPPKAAPPPPTVPPEIKRLSDECHRLAGELALKTMSKSSFVEKTAMEECGVKKNNVTAEDFKEWLNIYSKS